MLYLLSCTRREFHGIAAANVRTMPAEERKKEDDDFSMMRRLKMREEEDDIDGQ